jgi:purine-nucleoside phosphorylase
MEQKLIEAFDFNQNYELKVSQASTYLDNVLGKRKPAFGLTLGSGLGDLANLIDEKIEIPYAEIPNFPTTTVLGHEGKIISGKLNGVELICLKGRKHYYEVADEPFNNGILKVVFPIHTLANLGVRNYFATNAAGGLNLNYHIGDLMLIKSHINMIPNPLLGRMKDFKTIDGNSIERFQPMNNAYDSKLGELFIKSSFGIEGIASGVYLALTGPSYETEGECLAFRDGLFADAVGMSTAPEVIVARNRGMNTLGLSCITNIIAQNGENATNHEEVKAILESELVKNRLVSAVNQFFYAYRKD